MSPQSIPAIALPAVGWQPPGRPLDPIEIAVPSEWSVPAAEGESGAGAWYPERPLQPAPLPYRSRAASVRGRCLWITLVAGGWYRPRHVLALDEPPAVR